MEGISSKNTYQIKHQCAEEKVFGKQRSFDSFLISCLFVCVISFLSIICLKDNGSPWLMLIGFSIQSLVVILSVSKHNSISHPLIFFPLFYYPYSTWFAYNCLLSGRCEEVLIAQSIWLAMTGLLAYTIAVICTLVCLERRRSEATLRGVSVDKSLRLTLGRVASIVAIAGFTLLLFSGSSSKQQVLSVGGVIFSIATYATWISVAISLIEVASHLDQKNRWSVTLWLTVFAGFMAFLTVGERDHLFRFLVCCVFLTSSKKHQTNILTCALILIIAPLIIHYGGAYKAVLLQGSVHLDVSFVDGYFGNEFCASGRNLYKVLYHGVDTNWKYLFNDVFRGLMPFGNTLGLSSATGWFHNIYRVDNGFAGSSGWGLGYLSEGFVCGGVRGVIAIFFVVGCVMGALFRFRSRAFQWHVFYVLACTSAIYCMRADMAAFLSMTFKIGGSAILAPKIVGLLMSGRNRVTRKKVE